MSIVDAFFERLAKAEGPALSSTLAEDRPWLDAFADGWEVLRGANLVACVDSVAAKLFGGNVCNVFIVLAGNNLTTALVLLAAMRFRKTVVVLPSDTDDARIETVKSQMNREVRLIGTTAATQTNLSVTTISAAECRALNPLVPQETLDGFTDDNRPYLVTFTSGSTGVPKGVVHPATTFLNCATEFADATAVNTGETFLNVMPMHYMAGIFNGLLAPLYSGCNVVIAEQFSTKTAMTFWRLVESNEISALWLSPTMLSMVLKLDRNASQERPRDLKLFIGTGKLDADLAKQTLDKYGIVPIQSYGLSELLYISVDDQQNPGFGSVGYLLPSVKIILKDADEASLQGTATFKTPFAFLGYLDLDGQISFPSDGSDIFETSDSVELSPPDARGRIRLTVKMRNDDMILRGGINIDPSEVEQIIKEDLAHYAARKNSSDTLEFCIVGVEDKTLGQALSIVLGGELRLDREPALVLAGVNKMLPAGKKVDAIYQMDSLPKGPTGKLQRKKILQELVSQGKRIA